MDPHIQAPDVSTRSREAESPQGASLTEAEFGTPSPRGEDASGGERDWESFGSGESGREASMAGTLADVTDRVFNGDEGVGRGSEGGASGGEERAHGGDVLGGVRRGVVMGRPFEMGELEYLRLIPSFRIGEGERGGATSRETEGMACEEGGQATAGKVERDGLGSRGLRVAWWKMGSGVRETASSGGEWAKEEGRRGVLEGGRVMRKCVSACVDAPCLPWSVFGRLISDGRKNAVSEATRYTICIQRSVEESVDLEAVTSRM